jgi:hypothetical protein
MQQDLYLLHEIVRGARRCGMSSNDLLHVLPRHLGHEPMFDFFIADQAGC